ncbi:MAG: restriction endonuclease [Lachnospiraceae bacterium]|nr:restriction endonuclease [Lachnospiraceae bacterium]
MTNEQYLLLAVSAALLALLATVIIIFIRKGNTPGPLDEMEGHEFEDFCANLLRECGYEDVRVTKGSRDFGIDILAERDGVSYGFQCKHYTSPVGVKAVQETYAGRDYYDCMVGVVMANQYFTEPAEDAAAKLKILLWDREDLEQMMDESEQPFKIST